jgi:hypothetical protein
VTHLLYVKPLDVIIASTVNIHPNLREIEKLDGKKKSKNYLPYYDAKTMKLKAHVEYEGYLDSLIVAREHLEDGSIFICTDSIYVFLVKPQIDTEGKLELTKHYIAMSSDSGNY